MSLNDYSTISPISQGIITRHAHACNIQIHCVYSHYLTRLVISQLPAKDNRFVCSFLLRVYHKPRTGEYAREAARARKSATLGRLLVLFTEDWQYYVVAFVFLVAAALAQSVIPWLTGRAIDAVALGGPSLQDNHVFLESVQVNESCSSCLCISA